MKILLKDIYGSGGIIERLEALEAKEPKFEEQFYEYLAIIEHVKNCKPKECPHGEVAMVWGFCVSCFPEKTKEYLKNNICVRCLLRYKGDKQDHFDKECKK